MATNKKGRKIHISKLIKSSLYDQIEQHGVVTEVRKYKNAQLGAFFADGQFRFFRQNPTKKRSPAKKKLGPRKRSPTHTRSSGKKGSGASRASSGKKGSGASRASSGKKGSARRTVPTSIKSNIANMVGGESGDLKTSVNLLREYYSTRY